MNVSLTPELEKFVDGKVESGLYNNASEVVREGLRLLKEHDEIRFDLVSGSLGPTGRRVVGIFTRSGASVGCGAG